MIAKARNGEIAADLLDLESDVYCSICGTNCDYGDIAWMDKETGNMFCPPCHIPTSREYVVIEWLTMNETSVLHTAKAMELDKWR